MKSSNEYPYVKYVHLDSIAFCESLLWLLSLRYFGPHKSRKAALKLMPSGRTVHAR